MIYYETELYHYGVKGMKWGVRRYQRKDGTRTALGMERYKKSLADIKKRENAEIRSRYDQTLNQAKKQSTRYKGKFIKVDFDRSDVLAEVGKKYDKEVVEAFDKAFEGIREVKIPDLYEDPDIGRTFNALDGCKDFVVDTQTGYLEPGHVDYPIYVIKRK